MKSSGNLSWNVIGHEFVKKNLELQLNSGQISHAFLFAGPEGVGKLCLAQDFAAQLLAADNLLAHPDFKLVTVTNDTSVEQIRSVISGLAVRPFVGQYKVIIIDGAENLNLTSANTLLKTLEEPSPSTVLILISNKKNLLPTIVSRCQVVIFSELSSSNLSAIALLKGWQASEDALAQSQGRASCLRELVANPEASSIIEQKANLLFDAYMSDASTKILTINQLADLEQEDLVAILSRLLAKTRTMLKTNTQLVSLMSGCLLALNGLKANLNKKLVLQKLLMH
jgi:DNA polymerase-3 subunit delta'